MKFTHWLRFTSAGSIAFIYVVVASLWILLSDRLAHLIMGNLSELSLVQTFKGEAFVLTTGLLLYGLIARAQRRQQLAHAELAQAQQHLAHIVEVSPAVTYALKPSEHASSVWHPVYLSGNIEALTGFAVNDWLADPGFWFARLHPQDQAVVSSARDELWRTGSLRHQYRLQHRDGRFLWLEDHSVLNRGAHGEPQEIIGSLQDITDRKQAQESLEESERRWKFAIDGSDLGLWDWSIDTGHVFFSSRWKRMLGYADDEISSHVSEWESRVHTDDMARVLADVQRHMSGHTEFYSNEHRVRCKDGSYKWIMDRGKVVESHADGTPRRMIGTHTDLTALKQREESLALNAEVFNNSSEGIVVCGPDVRIVSINKAYTDITGYTAQDVIDRNPGLIKSGRHDRDFYRDMWTQIQQNGRWQGEIWNRRKDGEVYVEWMSIKRVTDNQGRVSHYFAIFSDITQRKLTEASISHLANYDSLTDLPNRALLQERAEHALAQAHRDKQSMAVLFLDLDRFKNVNDSLGHALGDQLLVEVAHRLKAQVREQDTVSRQGGDEFILLLPETEAEGAAHVAGKLIEAVSRSYRIGGHELSITPSIGIAMYPADGDDFASLQQAADAALFRAKREGRNTFQFFAAEMHAFATRALRLENALRRALDRQELLLHYQPQLELATGRIVGCEALLRWRHPELGMVSPADFIPVAEESGLILPIGDWVMRTAAAQNRAWQGMGLAPVVMAVNLSAVQFRQPNFLEQVQQVLMHTGLPAQWLEIELTESITMGDPEAAIHILERLHGHGVQLSIDDFGTGYSSLSYLKRFSINKLKIDQSFVRDLTVDPDSESIVTAVIGLARSLGLRTIAEGVETEAQLEWLRRNGCDEVQGYFVGRPVPAEELQARLR